VADRVAAPEGIHAAPPPGLELVVALADEVAGLGLAHWTTFVSEVEESLIRSPFDGQRETRSLDANTERPRPATG
jgi:hypothetical protein